MKRFLVWIAVLAVAAAAGFGLGALTYKPQDPRMDAASGSPTPVTSLSIIPPSPQVLPDLVGMKRAAAEKQLKKIGILFLVHPVGGKQDDTVASQFPAAGTPVAKARHVLINVRSRPAVCPQPPEGKQLYDPIACLWR